jgi:hypothetical protein
VAADERLDSHVSTTFMAAATDDKEEADDEKDEAENEAVVDMTGL